VTIDTCNVIEGLANWRHLHLGETESTNIDVLNAATAGDLGRLWVTADRQLSGRGRAGRQWISDIGNLYASVLLVDPAPLKHVSTLPFVAAVALHLTLAELPGMQRQSIQLKWPNDVLVNDEKISGILLESRTLETAPMVVACGFGVNVLHHPDPVLYLAALGVSILPHDLFRLLASNFDAMLKVWNEGKEFAAIRQEWLRHAKGIGEKIIVNLAGTVQEGIFEDLDSSGCLMLALPDKTIKTISAGDVFFPLMTGAFSDQIIKP
jgi:BirA family transcriptional regulator, biotin operon repressor / biotin---[acetyl-CoA-carboxylase] ligase